MLYLHDGLRSQSLDLDSFLIIFVAMAHHGTLPPRQRHFRGLQLRVPPRLFRGMARFERQSWGSK